MNGIEILDAKKQIAKANFLATIGVQDVTEADRNALHTASLWLWDRQGSSTNINVEGNSENATPTEDQCVRAEFRALSQDLLRSRGLDFSNAGVLEDGVEMLQGKTVYPNHQFSDINNALGVVSKSWWDSAGADSNGVPGINCEIKIDALMNLRIARGLMMNPPMINRMSLTVLFEFDYSHPRLVEERKFWDLVGEEVDGEIVRLIVIKILEIWEASLVFMGEDRLAKGLPKEAEETDETLETKLSAEEINKPSDTNKEKTMKLTKEQMEALGIDTEELSESQILEHALAFAKTNKEFDGIDLADLQAKAEVSDGYLELQRTEVRRLAKLAELGAEEGELDEVIETQITEASFETLKKLQTYYEKKAADKLGANSIRSSEEEGDEAENAGGLTVSNKPVQVDTLH